ncbi:MAG: DUF547 domain-containing protein [Phycisphaerae bacterium]
MDHATFDGILKKNVCDERVDYLSIRRHHWKELRDYLDRLAEVNAGALPRNEQLAYYINLYNATVIDAVIQRFKVGYSLSRAEFGVFREPLVRLPGRTVSLNDLENKIIRPTFKEPRIHVALVCAARSCPPLLPRAYGAEDLETVLAEGMRRFVNDPTHNKIDAERKRLRLSRIFDWYADDFGGRDALPKYLAKYTDAKLAGAKVGFLEYSWDLNIAPPREGKWVAIAADKAELRSAPDNGLSVGSAAAGEVFRVLEEQNGWVRIERPFDLGHAWLARRSARPFRLANP